MRWLLAAIAVSAVLLTAGLANAIPAAAAPRPTPSGNVRFEVTGARSTPPTPTRTPTGQTSSHGGGNANTGTPSGQLLLLAGGLIAIGSLVLFSGRRRRSRSRSTTHPQPHR